MRCDYCEREVRFKCGNLAAAENCQERKGIKRADARALNDAVDALRESARLLRLDEQTVLAGRLSASNTFTLKVSGEWTPKLVENMIDQLVLVRRQMEEP